MQSFGLNNHTWLRIINWISIQGLENTNSVASMLNVIRILPYPIFHSLPYHNKTGIDIGALEFSTISIIPEIELQTIYYLHR